MTKKLTEGQWEYICLKCGIKDKNIPLTDEQSECLLFQIILLKSEQLAKEEINVWRKKNE